MIDLDTVFRSIINFKTKENKETLTQKQLLKNFRALQQVVPKAPEEKVYKKLYHFIYGYLRNCDPDQPELPSYEFIKSHYENIEGDESVLAVLEKVKVQTPYVGQDYKTILKKYNDDQNTLKFEKVLSDANKIATTGLTVGRGRYKKEFKGVLDAISYISREAKDLTRDLTDTKTESQIVESEDSEEIIEEYNRMEADPIQTMGVSTWIKQLDKESSGIKNTEFWLIAAYTGHCKTTLSMNLAYRALFGGWNTGFITLEQTFPEIRRHLYVLHASNPKFKQVFPEYADLVGKINYNDVAYGRLTEREKEYWFAICRDFDKNFSKNSDSYGRMFIWQPPTSVVTTADIEMRMNTWNQELQVDNKGELELVVLDYISLMGATKSERTDSHYTTLNNIIKNLKRTCNSFNNGKGIRIVSPFQMNRTGYKEALANEGHYYLYSLSEANEAEKSADMVLSLFKFDEQNDNNRLRVCCLKNRRSEPFSPFDAYINFKTGFIYNFSEVVENSDNIDISGLV